MSEEPSRGERDPDGVRPVLFIGLGSTGAKIVSRLKKVIDKEGDPWTSRFYRYLRVTSEITPERGVDSKIAPFVLGERNLTTQAALEKFTRAVGGTTADRRKETIAEWWYPDDSAPAGQWAPWIPPFAALESGSGGVRPIGRLLLHGRALDADVGNLIERFRQEQVALRRERDSLPPEEQKSVDADKLDCFVFGLLAGGTCSGVVIDIALMLRQAFPTATINGVYLLGDICYASTDAGGNPYERRTQKYNTAAALAELMVVQSKTGRGIVLRNWVERIGDVDLPVARSISTSPYTSITLLGARNEEEYSLKTFDDYQEYVARFYGGLFASKVHAGRVGRAIDAAMSLALQKEQASPSRASSFQRIGFLSLRVPEEKIVALFDATCAQEIAIERFKNADAARSTAAIDSFVNQLRWADLSSQFEPPDDGILDALPGAPGKKEDFEALWQTAKDDIDTFYKPWRDADGPAASDLITQFLERASRALNSLLQDLLGQYADRPMVFGSLEFVVKSLLDMMRTRKAEYEATVARVENRLFSSGAASLAGAFMARLGEALSDYPSAFNILARGRLKGAHRDLIEALREYREALRLSVVAASASAALSPLLRQLEALTVTRQVVSGKHGAQRVFMDKSRAAQAVFDLDKQRIGTCQDVIADEDRIKRLFVAPLLDEPASAASGLSRKETYKQRVLAGWETRQGQPFYDVFVSILDKVQARPNCATDEDAMRVPEIRAAADALREGLTKSFAEATQDLVTPEVRKLSIWQALATYVREVGGDPDDVLRRMFAGFASRAKFFTQLGASASRDTYERVYYRFYVCNEMDAARCFQSLGLAAPESYLHAELLPYAFGRNLEALPSTDASRHELLLFQFCEGDLPSMVLGFEEAVTQKLANVPAAQRKNYYEWSDVRFPEWIEQWWTANPPPHLPIG